MKIQICGFGLTIAGKYNGRGLGSLTFAWSRLGLWPDGGLSKPTWNFATVPIALLVSGLARLHAYVGAAIAERLMLAPGADAC